MRVISTGRPVGIATSLHASAWSESPEPAPEKPRGSPNGRWYQTAVIERGGTAVIPICKNGRAWKEDGLAARARNETLRATQRFGRALWKPLTGTHARRRIEAQMRRLKSFGERIMARDPDRQTAEIHLRIALMNRFSAPEHGRDHAHGLNQRDKGQLRSQLELCNICRRPERKRDLRSWFWRAVGC